MIKKFILSIRVNSFLTKERRKILEDQNFKLGYDLVPIWETESYLRLIRLIKIIERSSELKHLSYDIAKYKIEK